MNNLLWRLVAFVVTRQWAFDLLQRLRQPYFHITSADGTDVYMERYWLFNPYTKDDSGVYTRRFEWLPSIRLHRIMRPDNDRHLHDHPWNARTIILRGWYHEIGEPSGEQGDTPAYYMHEQGYTGRLLYGQYHRIASVPKDGVWTLFFTWRFQGDWGFDVDGVKVPHKVYLSNERK